MKRGRLDGWVSVSAAIGALVGVASISVFASCASGSDEGGGTSSDTGSAIDSGATTDEGTDLGDDAGGDSGVDSGSIADGGDVGGGDVDLDADAPMPWPTCDSKPDLATTTTIPEIWTANPSTPQFSWVSGAIVTAVSKGACVAGSACNVFLEDAGTFASLAEAAHHAIKIFVSPTAASHFVGIAVGDQVDVAGWAWRYTVGGENELLIQVADTPLRGCFKKTGSGSIDPVDATLSDLGTVSAYEDTYGPVLVKLANVSGRPATPSATFGLWPTGMFDAGGADIVSLSPYFLAGGAFTGLTSGTITDFASIVGVYGLFYPGAPPDGGTATKYLEVYPRVMSEVVLK